MHIVYLLTHKQRLEENNPPYFYIGSKWNWKGEGSYKSSSRSNIIRDAYAEDLFISVIWYSEDCSKEELLNKEKEYQLAHDVIGNPKFFNKNIANTYLFSGIDVEKRIEKWKTKATSLNSEGVPYSKIWAAKSQKVIQSKYTKEEISRQGRERMFRIRNDGKTVLEIVHSKMMETMSKVDENGLTGFQSAGKKLSEKLNTVCCDVSGITYAEKRKYFGSEDTRFVLFNFTFFNRQQASRLLGVDVTVVDNLIDGYCSDKSFNKLIKLFDEEVVSSEIKIQKPGNPSITICGKYFPSLAAFAKEMGVTRWAIEQFSKNKFPNKKLKSAMISYFGKETYEMYYPAK